MKLRQKPSGKLVMFCSIYIDNNSLCLKHCFFNSHGDDTTSENSCELNMSFESGQKKSSPDAMKDNESSESTRKRKEQDDAKQNPKCNMDSKDTILTNAADGNDTTGQMKPSNGEKASEPSSPDPKLSKLSCTATEMTNLTPPLNASETCSTDVEMVSPHSPTCKERPINLGENASACPDSESKTPIPNPDDDTKDTSEVTEMETDVEQNSTTVTEESNCNQTSSSARYTTVFCEFWFYDVF